ncbi:MAG: hypothetical protein QNK37_30325 [Acidobacteriota bacterium]|nr:hypothetical protein [Acidobacteriota bacterium]
MLTMGWVLFLFPLHPDAGMNLVARREPARNYARESWEPRLEELRAAFGQNKKIPKRYELEILLALSHYPELARAHINFKLTMNRVPATSRPRIYSLFFPRDKRRYLVTISETDSWGASKAVAKNQSFDARIGLIGHELAHTVHYHRKNVFGIIGMGLNLLNPKQRARFERRTDQRAIDHGLGWQLHQWALELRGGSDIGNSWLDAFYMTPGEIRREIERNSRY